MVSKQAIIESFRKGFKDKTNFFIPFIFLLTVAAVIFDLMALLNVQYSTNPSFFLNNYSISFNIGVHPTSTFSTNYLLQLF